MRISANRTTRTVALIGLALLASGGSIAGCGGGDDGDEAGGGPPGTCTDPATCEGGVPTEGGQPSQEGCTDTGPEPVPVTTHPRLFLTSDDVTRLRGWAVASNPIWANGLGSIATRSRADMDAGKITGEDTGSAYSYTPYPAESYAMLFAFLSLVDADDATRADDAKRARTLLMHVIDKAALGVADAPFRGATFSTSNRSRWWGEGFGLTVDWIYGTLSSDDKAKIRTVFLRWSDENENAEITTLNHPEPKGVRNDPQLTADPERVYWAGNNYYTAHMRNLALMAMAFDEADDPGGALRAHLESATGAWLYVADALLRGALRGGLPAEGFEYGPQAVGYVTQTLLALHTAGLDSAKKYGRQTRLACNPVWDNAVTAFLHSVSPTGQVSNDPNYTYMGPLHSVAWYGDGAKFWAPDYIGEFGALGAYDLRTKNTARLAKLRWIETNVPPGGADKIGNRTSARDFLIEPILYFMLLDPTAPADPDPRPKVPLGHFDPGLGHLFARTDWGADASWFTYNLGWSRIDHQHADGNLFQLWRKGEWLTKERSGYGLRVACSDYKNALALQNDAPDHNAPGDYGNIEWTRGSQWTYVNDGPGKILAQVLDPKYVYALGDATPLYSSTYEKATDVTHASRSIVWLPPDRIVVYDRAASKTAGRFKRFWLNLPANGAVAGRVMTMTSAKGQKLFVSSLLPAAATMTVEAAEGLDGEPGELDPIKYRMRVEATGGPTSVRFMHVIKGADGAASADATALVTSTGGTPYEGAAANGVVVLFPVDIATPFASVTYTVPGGTVAQLVTGLMPGAGYTVAQNGATVTVTPGGGKNADSGGVLVIGALP
ncbi:MAG TPA: hypothetical protein VLT33_26965 [Labilithrix sp.]|nr:hypothetical protein [Labilithrix sp.]